MAGAAILCIEVDPSRIERRLETRYLDEAADVSRRRARAGAGGGGRRRRRCRSACSGTPRKSCRSSHSAASTFDLVTDQTAAHDPLNGYVPAGLSVDAGRRASRARPGRVPAPRRGLDRHACARAARVRPSGQLCFRLWQQPERGGARGRRRGRVHIPGLCPGLYPAALLPWHRPLPVGCPLGRARRHRGDRRDVWRTCSRTTVLLQRWLELAPDRVAFQGLPARICWLGYGARAKRRAGDQRACAVRATSGHRS